MFKRHRVEGEFRHVGAEGVVPQNATGQGLACILGLEVGYQHQLFDRGQLFADGLHVALFVKGLPIILVAVDGKEHLRFDLLEAVDMPGSLGFQADLAHTYLYLMGYNAPEHALLKEGYSDEEFWAAYEKMTDALRPWTIDFHVAQNDGTVHGSGAHDKTGRHCPADDPNGKLDIVKCAGYWLKDASARGIQHICWDGCMFPNEMLEQQATWNKILGVMLKVRESHGWS